MIDATNLKAHRPAASLLKGALFGQDQGRCLLREGNGASWCANKLVRELDEP